MELQLSSVALFIFLTDNQIKKLKIQTNKYALSKITENIRLCSMYTTLSSNRSRGAQNFTQDSLLSTTRSTKSEKSNPLAKSEIPLSERGHRAPIGAWISSCRHQQRWEMARHSSFHREFARNYYEF
jgi:hypothetical protein